VKVAKTKIYLILALLVGVIIPGQVWGQRLLGGGAAGESTLRRSVPPDAETMVSSASRWFSVQAGLCRTANIPTLDLVTPPKHGTVQFVITDIGIPRGSGCSNSVFGRAVLYHPAPGFVGEDQFAYDSPDDPTVMNWTDRPGRKTVIVTVRDQSQLAR
jgi:hypothetical protein